VEILVIIWRGPPLWRCFSVYFFISPVQQKPEERYVRKNSRQSGLSTGCPLVEPCSVPQPTPGPEVLRHETDVRRTVPEFLDYYIKTSAHDRPCSYVYRALPPVQKEVRED
jgi:hypothetical protein